MTINLNTSPFYLSTESKPGTGRKDYFFMPKIVFLKNHPEYFITHKYSVFKIKRDGSHRLIKPMISDKAIRVHIGDDKKYLINIILEAFYPNYNGRDFVDFKIKDGKIIQGSIKIIANSDIISDEDIDAYTKYKCLSKAHNSNSRCTYKINGHDVLATLKRHNFKCHFCKSSLDNSWQLDHFFALSKGGKNKPDNIVPTCKRCNQMKGDMDGFGFINRCREIVKKTQDYEIPIS